MLKTTLLAALLASPLIANDNFSDALPINYTGEFIAFIGNTDDATREEFEPTHGATKPTSPANASHWYAITVDEARRIEVIIDYEGTPSSGLDALVAIYTGDDLQTLTEVSRYPDLEVPAKSARRSEPFTTFARLNFDAVPGTNYHLAVDGEGNHGPYRLVLQPSRDPHSPTAELLPPGSLWRSFIARDPGDNPDSVEDDIPIDPIEVDPDFFTKWHNSANLTELGFTSAHSTPIAYGNVVGLHVFSPATISPLWNPLDATASPPSGNRYTSYHRTTFTPETQVKGLGFEGLFDDGFIIHINGEEVARANLAPEADPLNWQTLASETSIPGIGDSEKVSQYAAAPDLILPAGVEVEVAISLHNQSPSSTDMGFDLRIWALEGGVPITPNSSNFRATVEPTESDDLYRITWPSRDGQTYQIQTSSSLLEDSWTDVFDSDIDPEGTGTNSELISSDTPQRFWRVLVR